MFYRVYGHTTVTISTIVEANSKEEALRKAEADFKGIDSFLGNGGSEKLIGVNGENDTIAADDEIVFDVALDETDEEVAEWLCDRNVE